MRFKKGAPARLMVAMARSAKKGDWSKYARQEARLHRVLVRTRRAAWVPFYEDGEFMGWELRAA